MSEQQQTRFIDRFPNLRERRIFNLFRGPNEEEPPTDENLDTEQQLLVQHFTEGMADAIGIPAIHFNANQVRKWILTFGRAFVKPEFLDQTVAPTTETMQKLGHDLGDVIREAIEKLDATEDTNAPDQIPVDEQAPDDSRQGVRNPMSTQTQPTNHTIMTNSATAPPATTPRPKTTVHISR